jgi:DNA polymerase-4
LALATDQWPQIIAHADMDAFYASVEQLDDPRLRGKPLLVGPRSGRGVVLTASYEARPFGVGSAMPMARALKLCPQALVVPPRFERYRELSAQIMNTFRDFSPKVEPLSLDEAFMEMSGAQHIFGPPQAMGQAIKDAIHQVTGGLRASVGVATSKYVAKVASGHAKPDGLTIVTAEEAVSWLAPMSIARLWGAGPKTQSRMRALNLNTIADVAAADPVMLNAKLGQAGRHFFDLAHARDPRPVHNQRTAHSMSSDRTLQQDVTSLAEIRQHLKRCADRIGRRLRRKAFVAGGVRVKLKTSKFELLSRQCTLLEPTNTASELFDAAVTLLARIDHPGPFRLVGLAAHSLVHEPKTVQLSLFNPNNPTRQLEKTLDQLADRYGDGIVRRARDLSKTTIGDFNPDLDGLDDLDKLAE